MNNTTTTINELWGYSTTDLEIANLIQGGCSFVATCIILIRVLDIPSFFRSVREKRKISKKNKERKELERLKKLMDGLKNGGADVSIEDLLSDDEDTEAPENSYKIARKKNTNYESKV